MTEYVNIDEVAMDIIEPVTRNYLLLANQEFETAINGFRYPVGRRFLVNKDILSNVYAPYITMPEPSVQLEIDVAFLPDKPTLAISLLYSALFYVNRYELSGQFRQAIASWV